MPGLCLERKPGDRCGRTPLLSDLPPSSCICAHTKTVTGQTSLYFFWVLSQLWVTITLLLLRKNVQYLVIFTWFSQVGITFSCISLELFCNKAQNYRCKKEKRHIKILYKKYAILGMFWSSKLKFLYWLLQIAAQRNHQRQRSLSLLDQQQQIDHLHCHLWVFVQRHAEHPLLKNTHTNTFRTQTNEQSCQQTNGYKNDTTHECTHRHTRTHTNALIRR